MRADHKTIIDWVPARSRVLDLGCGEGDLLAALKDRKNVRGVGLELSLEAVAACIRRGVSAYQGDLDKGLADLRSGSYDVVILNETLQMVKTPRFIMSEAVRVGKRVIVGFPNFGYWAVRAQVLAGRTPETKSLPYRWYNSPNLHFMSVHDFRDFAREEHLRIRREAHFNHERRVYALPNLLATSSLFELESTKGSHV